MPKFVFIIITLLSIAFFYLGTGRDKRVLCFLVCWLVLIGGLSYAGFFEDTTVFPPRILAVLLPAILYAAYFYRKLDVSKLNVDFLLALHSLRLPVELVLHKLYLMKLIPKIMTYEGWNFDIIIGVSAILLLFLRFFTRRELRDTVYRVWNIAGILLLANIVGIAILSAPSPLQQLAYSQPNVAILRFPFTLLPAIVVPLVLLAHLLFLKKVRAAGNPKPS